MVKKRKDLSRSAGDVGSSLRDALLGQGFTASTAPPPAPAPLTEAEHQTVSYEGVRLRIERKGRKGKTVTLVDNLPAGVDKAALCRALKKSLGCGAGVEGERIVLQGDQRARGAAFFA